MFNLDLEKAEEPEIKLPTSVGSLKKQESSRKTSQFSSVQSLSLIGLFATPWIAVLQASLSITNSWSLPKLMSIESVMPSTVSSSVFPFSSCLQSFPTSGSFQMSQLFASGGQNVGASASVSVLPINIQYWFPLWLTGLIAIQGTLKSLLQQHSSKASIFLHSGFFIVQLSHPYMTTGKTIAMTRWTFVGEVMSLFFNMLSRLIITFLPRSKCLLISWLQSPSAVILGPQKIKVSHCVHCFLHVFAMKWWDWMPWY